MIEWSEPALLQLDQAYDFIALSNSETVAGRILFRILDAVQSLDQFPMAGRTGRIENTRELVIAGTPYIAAYRIEERRILILAVYHGAQRWPEIL